MFGVTYQEVALRMARILVIASFLTLPAHFWVPCEASVLVGGFAVLLWITTATLRLIARRFHPFGWATAALLMHSASTH
jgi:hypothetical protein